MGVTASEPGTMTDSRAGGCSCSVRTAFATLDTDAGRQFFRFHVLAAVRQKLLLPAETRDATEREKP